MKRNGYAQAADHLHRVERLCAAAGEPQRFASIVAAIRTEHRRKLTLMDLLARARW